MLTLVLTVTLMLQEYMADHDQQYLIEMDANQTANTLFKVSKSLT